MKVSYSWSRIARNATLAALGATLTSGVCFTQSSARADCASAKGLKTFSSDWFMAQGCDVALSSAKDAAGSVLSDMGKSALSMALNAYCPGLATFVGLGAKEDPFALYAQQILDAIDAAKAEINSNTTFVVDDLWHNMIALDETQIFGDFVALRSGWADWNNDDWTVKVGNNSIDDIVDDLTLQLGQIESHMLFLDPGRQSMETPPYPFMSLAHQYPLLSKMSLGAQAQKAVWGKLKARWTEAVKNGVTEEQFASFLSANSVSSEQAVNNEIKSDTLMRYSATASLVSKLQAADAFMANLNWEIPIAYSTSQKCTYGGLKGFNYEGQLYMFMAAYQNDRWCATRAAPKDEFDAALQKANPPYPYEFCSPDPGKVDAGDPSICAAFDRSYKDFLRKREPYLNVMMVGYSPLRVTLDSLWDRQRQLGLSSGERAYNGLDAQMDALLWDARYAKIGAAVSDFLATTSAKSSPLTPAQRSRYVGFALQYGADELIGLSQDARAFDALSAGGDYPLEAHRAYLEGGEHSAARAQSFYRAQFAAKFAAL